MLRQLIWPILAGKSSLDVSHVMQFVTIGDWGELGPALYTTANRIRSYVDDPRNLFVALVGDNFYPGGLSSSHDPAFTEIFEEPFEACNCLFHPILGDNDYGSKEKSGSLYAQVRMSRKNPHWLMPALYYSRHIETAGVSLCAIFIDTQSMIEVTYPEDRTRSELRALSAQLEWLRVAPRFGTLSGTLQQTYAYSQTRENGLLRLMRRNWWSVVSSACTEIPSALK